MCPIPLHCCGFAPSCQSSWLRWHWQGRFPPESSYSAFVSSQAFWVRCRPSGRSLLPSCILPRQGYKSFVSSYTLLYIWVHNLIIDRKVSKKRRDKRIVLFIFTYFISKFYIRNKNISNFSCINGIYILSLHPVSIMMPL